MIPAIVRRAYSLIALALPALAFAAGLPPVSTDETSLDFALQLGKTQTVFDYARGSSVDTSIERLGIGWYQRIAPRLELGLFGGRAFLTQTDNPATAGLEPDGYYAGIGLRGVLLDTSAVQLFWQVTDSYQRLRHEDSGQSVTLSWNQPQAQLGMVLLPTTWARVYGGATWSSIDGQERDTGTAARTIDFERGGRSGVFFGIDLAVERDGYVGIELRSGIERGGEIYFKKRF